LSATNQERMLSKVKQWAVQSGLKVTSIADSKHDFVLEVSENESLPIVQIIHRRNDTAFVLIVGLVNIPEADRNKLKSAKLAQFSELIWGIKLDLLHQGVDFTVLGSEKDPDTWEVQKRLFVNESNVDQFYEAYSRVKNSLIGIIWSYKSALDISMAIKESSENEMMVVDTIGIAIQSNPDRTQKVMNAIVNTSIILMSTFMDGFTRVMMETTGAMASEMAGVMDGEEAREEVDIEFQEDLPEAEEKMKATISDVRKEVYDQFEQKRAEIEPFLADEGFDLGPKIIDGYDFNLPKLTEELDDGSITKYIQLLESEDPSFTEMFRELTEWMNILPKFPKKSDDN
jgi:hypothetical protein